MLTAIRPASLGTVRPMNFRAECRATTGNKGSGVRTAPRVDTAWDDEGELHSHESEHDPRPICLAQLVVDGSKADVRQLAEDPVSRDRDERHQQEVSKRDGGASQPTACRAFGGGQRTATGPGVGERRAHAGYPSSVPAATLNQVSPASSSWSSSRSSGVNA